MGQPKPKRKTRCNNTNTINATKKSTHRRPVKKRRVVSVKELSVTTAFTTSTTTGLPDLVHETNATVMTAAAAAATTTTTTTVTTPCSTTTSKTAVASIGDTIDRKPSVTSFVVDAIDTHTKPHSPKNDHENEIDIPNEKDEFEVVPSPPPFARSVAQVIRNKDGNSTNHYFHHEPKLRYPQQEPQYRQCPISSPATTTESPFVSTIVTQHGNTNDIVTELSPRFSPSKAKVPHHRRSLASFSYDLPPIHDLVASLSLSSSSLPNTTSVTNEASMSAHKNHNKLLPKSHNCKKSISLMNDVDDDEEECGNETYETLSTATAATTAIASTKVDNVMIYSRTSSAMFHSNPSDRMDVTSTNPTIPSALMSGKVISTKYGLAMLVVPSSDITVSDYTSTFASSMAVHALTNNNVVSSLPPDTASNAGTCNSHSTATPSVATRFKHWLTSEDELLRYAITKQMHGPPYMWQQIAQTYFPNTRNANQVRNIYVHGICSFVIQQSYSSYCRHPCISSVSLVGRKSIRH